MAKRIVSLFLALIMITGVMTVVTPAGAQGENAIYVSPQGSDEADGSF